jgi:Homologous recombination OB-fold protein
MQHAHNGESYIKFKDPSGTIGGTFVSDVLSLHQNITPGAVVLLEKVTVLKTPPPHSLHHLCIVPENVVRVIPRQRSGQPFGGTPLFKSSQAPSGAGGGGDGGNNVTGVVISAGQQDPPARVVNNARMHQPAQLETRNDYSSAVQQMAAQLPQQLGQQQHPQPSIHIQPQIDSADDLLEGLDDEFGF